MLKIIIAFLMILPVSAEGIESTSNILECKSVKSFKLGDKKEDGSPTVLDFKDDKSLYLEFDEDTNKSFYRIGKEDGTGFEKPMIYFLETLKVFNEADHQTTYYSKDIYKQIKDDVFITFFKDSNKFDFSVRSKAFKEAPFQQLSYSGFCTVASD